MDVKRDRRWRLVLHDPLAVQDSRDREQGYVREAAWEVVRRMRDQQHAVFVRQRRRRTEAAGILGGDGRVAARGDVVGRR